MNKRQEMPGTPAIWIAIGDECSCGATGDMVEHFSMIVKPSPYPFCVDCKHFMLSADLGIISDFAQWCVGVISPVTGKPKPTQCEFVRAPNSAFCGLEGRLFEPAIKPVPGLVAYARGQLKAKETE